MSFDSDKSSEKTVSKTYKYLFGLIAIIIIFLIVFERNQEDIFTPTVTPERKETIAVIKKFVNKFNSNKYNNENEKYNKMYSFKSGILTSDKKDGNIITEEQHLESNFNTIKTLNGKIANRGKFLIVTIQQDGASKKINSDEPIIIEIPRFGNEYDNWISVGFANGKVETYQFDYIISFFKNKNERLSVIEKDFGKEALLLLKSDKL